MSVTSRRSTTTSGAALLTILPARRSIESRLAEQVELKGSVDRTRRPIVARGRSRPGLVTLRQQQQHQAGNASGACEGVAENFPASVLSLEGKVDSGPTKLLLFEGNVESTLCSLCLGEGAR
jgi:hypothetical protein